MLVMMRPQHLLTPWRVIVERAVRSSQCATTQPGLLLIVRLLSVHETCCIVCAHSSGGVKVGCYAQLPVAPLDRAVRPPSMRLELRRDKVVGNGAESATTTMAERWWIRE